MNYIEGKNIYITHRAYTCINEWR